MKNQEYSKKLIELIQSNPELPIVPFVDNELFSDDYAWMMGSWGNSEINEYYIDDERVWLKDDTEDLVDKLIDERIDDEWKNNTDEEMEQMAKEIVNGYKWIKCIVVRIVT